MYVYFTVGTYVCICMCMYVRMYACLHACTHASVVVCVCVCVCEQCWCTDAVIMVISWFWMCEICVCTYCTILCMMSSMHTTEPRMTKHSWWKLWEGKELFPSQHQIRCVSAKGRQRKQPLSLSEHTSHWISAVFGSVWYTACIDGFSVSIFQWIESCSFSLLQEKRCCFLRFEILFSYSQSWQCQRTPIT